MAKQSIITNAGLELLATSSKVSGQHYWLGYYALAYVPSAWKSNQTTLPECSPDGFTLSSLPNEPLTYTMQNLTVDGDIIYNVFQGDLIGTGYRRGSDGSAGGTLFGLSMYDQNIKKHYRYCLDANGNNQLIAWENADRTKPTGSLIGSAIYAGTNGFNPGAMPIPAPLFHGGDVTGKFSVSNYFPDITNEITNGSSIYKHATYSYGADLPMRYPLVTADYRGYTDMVGGDETASYAHKTAGTQFDDKELATAVLPGMSGEVTAWFSSYSTTVNDVGEYTGTVADTLWKVASISNYNRYHAPVSSLGNTLNSDLASRNMSTATKFFPIANYKVINSVSGFTADKELREVATSIALTIDIDLSPSTKANGYDESNFNYDDNANLTFFDKYSENQGDYAKTSTSFKFNRIGIYAVALNDSPYTIRRSDDTELPGTVCEVQFSINPDVEPILFAVVDFDNTVYLSDTGDGLHRFRADVNLNLDAAGEDALTFDSELVRDSVIFYNMYQDDALTWYQNQLIATASTQHAIMEFGLELTNIKARLGDLACCPTPNYDERYALKNHSHGKSIRNIEDSVVATNGGLRGYDTAKEGDDTGKFESTPYLLGIDSITFGKGTYAFSDHVLVSGVDNIIYGGDSTKLATLANKNKSIGSIILGGSKNVIFNASNSGLLASTNSSIDSHGNPSSEKTEYSAIIASKDAYINVCNGFIAASESCKAEGGVGGGSILSSVYSSILTSSGFICSSHYSYISGGMKNAITQSTHSNITDSTYSVIDASDNCSIMKSTRSQIIGSEDVSIIGTTGELYTSAGNFVFGSRDSTLNDCNNSFVFGGNERYGTTLTNVDRSLVHGYEVTLIDTRDSIIGCTYYTIKNTHNSIVHVEGSGSRDSRTIEDLYGSLVVGMYHTVHHSDSKIFPDNHVCLLGVLIAGSTHTMIESDYSLISGLSNKISYSMYSNILGGSENTIYGSDYTSIIGGKGNRILYTATNSTILGGSKNTISTQFDSRKSSHKEIIRGHATILGGRDCTVTHFGEIAHSNGAISTDDNAWLKDGGIDQGVNIVSKLTKTLTTSTGPYKATSKHSVYMLGGVIDAWLNDPTDAHSKRKQAISVNGDGKVEYNGVDGNDTGFVFQFLTLDNREFLEYEVDQDGYRDIFIRNSINLDRGESIAGTVKFIVHIPFSEVASLTCDKNDDGDKNDIGTDHENNSGASFSALYSITAHRDVVGRTTVSTQLIDESMAIMNLNPMSDYGIKTSIKAYSEYASENDGVDVTGSGYSTGLQGLTKVSNYSTLIGDGHSDTRDTVDGRFGGLVFTVDLDTPWKNIHKLYSSRYVFCSAVVDVVSINSGNILFPTIE